MVFDVAALAASLRPLAAQYRPDTYVVLRATLTSDGAGGSTTVEGAVESGGCILVAGGLRPEERAIADANGSTVPYALRNMPYNSIVKASDVVTVGARRFECIGIVKAAAANVAVTAIVEERT